MDSDSTPRWLTLEKNCIAAHPLVSEFKGSLGLSEGGRLYLLRQAALKSPCKGTCNLGWEEFMAIIQVYYTYFLASLALHLKECLLYFIQHF